MILRFLICVSLLGLSVAAPAAQDPTTFARQLQQWLNGATGPAAWQDFDRYHWTLVNGSTRWSPRAGLQVLAQGERLVLMGGRTPNPPQFPPIPGDSVIHGDVWVSEDRGSSWHQVLATGTPDQWPARAYFQALKRGRYLYLMGGQNFNLVPNACPPGVPNCPPFVSQSDFFNDVWRSRDGVHWQQLTAAAGWEGRAGLSATVHRGAFYVAGGSRNDDDAIIGGPPQRIYYNDVWKSYNGRDWQRVTEQAPWAARAGGVLLSKDGYLYLLGGEVGFVCAPLPTCTPPYFNDVWRSKDGAHWEQVTASAGWSPRPGHQCVVAADHLVCFGGFGLLANPMDVWVSREGREWTQVSDSPWNAVAPSEIKYDFDALVITEGQRRPVIFTFGGDRETFDFDDPLNYLNVDNDVWRFESPVEAKESP
ncbi:hypothetical protein [Ferrimonas balearica]|uniref:hypothetical protein n=1 Tax=Ferrimonas balearica TaxID=44012 RepID=UPI001C99C774|nr:hypothetical protein [Ferrimonas balearica]MBY5991436.1 hypothetical protein [Ferrimonas balearica]